MEISVREAILDDVPAMAVVNLASWEAAYRGITPDAFLDEATLEERTARWTEALTTGEYTVLVAAAGDELLAYCSLELPSRDGDGNAVTAKIRAFYVRPASFRRGVGSTLMRGALARLADRGFREVTLWVLTANTNARAFYARHAFIPDGGISFWLDDIEQIRLRRTL